MEQLINKIKEQIDRYEEIYKTSSIDTLLNASDWFSIQATRLAEFLANFKENYNKYYYIRKLNFAQSKQGFINDKKMSVAQAEVESAIECAEYLDKELKTQSTAYRVELLLKQVNILIQTIQQRISYLKIEKRNIELTQNVPK